MDEYIEDTCEEEEEMFFQVCKPRKYRKVKRKIPEPTSSFDFPGVEKVVLTENSQRALKVVCGRDVTSENPWKYIDKELIIADIKNNDDLSDFVPIKKKVTEFPNSTILIIYSSEESEDEDKYFICLSIDAEQKVNDVITKMKAEREERLNNATFKTAKPWEQQGSASEVLDMLPKTNRPLIEVEVETSYPIKPVTSRFKQRLVERAKDGYIEILSLRTVFTNVFRKKLEVGVQANPSVVSVASQTVCQFPKNVIIQYNYTYNLPKETKEYIRNLKYFAHNTMNIFDDSIYVNGSMDFYTSDYNRLIKTEVGPEKPQETRLLEFTKFYEHDMEKGKVISAICWHPFWTGIAAISYSNQSLSLYNTGKPSIDDIYSATFELTAVHLWSTVDTLSPRLLLEIHRDISALSFCPYNENLLIGGCVNGQIIVWDITNKLQQVEEEEVLSTEQRSYRIKMHSMMSWMKNTKNPQFVRVTIVSQLEHSPTSAITAITWISPFKEVNKAGKVSPILKSENRTSLQFSTTSLDGTLQFWDLKGKPPVSALTSHKKYRHLKSRPAALTTDESPLKVFHRILKPIFKVNVFAPHTSRHLPLTVVGRAKGETIYKEKFPNANRKFDVSERIHYKAELEDNTDFENEYILGSVEGDFFKIKFEGYDYTSNEAVSKEAATLHNFLKFHDGLLVVIKLCPVFSDVVLTVGGNIFAIWLLQFTEKPIIWRKCSCRYTHGVWTANRFSAIRLCRSDGYVELWNFTIRSDCWISNTLRSGKWVASSVAHVLPLQQQIVGLSDYTNAFRLFFMDKFVKNDEEEAQLYKLLCKDAERKRCNTQWNDQWNTKNTELVASHRAKLTPTVQRKQEEKAVQVREEVSIEKPIEQINLDIKWRQKEVQWMNLLLLGKKGLDKAELEMQQTPLIKVREEGERKKEKLKTALDNAPKVYENAVAMMFPEAIQKGPLTPLDPYKGAHYIYNKSIYYDSYVVIAEKYEQFVKNNVYQQTFNWLKMAKSGKERRLLLDGYNTRYVHKCRIIQDKILRQQSLVEKKIIYIQNDSDT